MERHVRWSTTSDGACRGGDGAGARRRAPHDARHAPARAQRGARLQRQRRAPRGHRQADGNDRAEDAQPAAEVLVAAPGETETQAGSGGRVSMRPVGCIPLLNLVTPH
jgi:hypothetical protein